MTTKQDAAAIVARIADEEAVAAHHVSNFEDRLAEFGLAASDLTPVVIAKAHHIHEQAMAEIKDRVARLNGEKPEPRKGEPDGVYLKQGKKGWWIKGGDIKKIGPYRTKAEAEADLRGMKQFKRLNPDLYEEKTVKTTTAKLRSLYEKFGFANVAEWTEERLIEKLPKMIGMFDDDITLNKTERKLFDGIAAAVKDGTEVTLSDAKGDKPEPEEKPTKAKKEKGKKGKKAKEEDKPEEKPTKAKGSKKPKKNDKPKGPGVIASILERLKKASKTKPVTKEQILEFLVDRFPDRDKESMKKTVNVQVPTRISKEKDVDVKKHDKGGYYVPRG